MRGRDHAPLYDISVRTYTGTVDGYDPADEFTGASSYIWNPSLGFYNSRYESEHDFVNNISEAGCYMQRLSMDIYSAFEIKDNVRYRGQVGYRIYDSSYDIDRDSLFRDIEPMYSDESIEFVLEWWHVDYSLASTLNTGVAMLATLLTIQSCL